MKLTRKFAFFTIAAATLVSCSMYSSAGRKNFESNTPGQIHATSLHSTKDFTTKTSTSDSTTCWQQPAGEPLWLDSIAEFDEDVSLAVRKISRDEIEVCFDPSAN